MDPDNNQMNYNATYPMQPQPAPQPYAAQFTENYEQQMFPPNYGYSQPNYPRPHFPQQQAYARPPHQEAEQKWRNQQ